MSDQKRSVPSFFILLFILSIPFWILDALHPIQLMPGLPLSALGTFTPAIAAGILVYQSSSAAGVLALLRRSVDFNRVVKKSWYSAFFLINPVIAVLAYLILRAGNQKLPIPAPLTFSALSLFLLFLIAALGEELGWTGYATEPLLQRWGTLPTGILLGAVWSVFHFIPLLQVQRPLAWIAWWTLGTIALRVIMIWLYTRAGKSVFAASIFHATINLCWQLFPINGSYYDPGVFSLLTFGFALVISILSMLPDKKKNA